MSIWTDLLLLGGYVATPAGLAAVVPDTHAAAPSPAVAETPRPRRARVVPAPRPLPRANKISPNDLW